MFLIDDWVEAAYDWLSGSAARRDAAKAAAKAAAAVDRSIQTGMDKQLGAQAFGFGAATGALDPYAERGLGYLDRYADMAMNPNLDAIRKEREQASADLNAQLAGMGMHNSGFAAKTHSALGADYASKMYDARMRAMMPLIGIGPAAAGGIAGAAGKLGEGSAQTYQQGYGQMANNAAQQGMINQQLAMAPHQQLMNMLGLGMMAYGTFRGPRG